MKKLYNTAQINVVHLRAHDIIVTSPDGFQMLGITPNATDVPDIDDAHCNASDFVW